MMNDAENMAYVLTDFFDSIKKRRIRPKTKRRRR